MAAIYNPGSAFTITSGYGSREDPNTHIPETPHHGVDFAAPSGTPIPAAADGTVFFSGWMPGYGNCIVIEHSIEGQKVYTLYGHMNEPSGLHKGDVVEQGQSIGNVGNTGLSTGPHLHFEVIPPQPAPLKQGHETINPMRFGFPDGGNQPSVSLGSSDPMYPPGGYNRMRDPDAFAKLGGVRPPIPNSPLVLDLDGGGIATTAVSRFGTYFDLDANGFVEAVGLWSELADVLFNSQPSSLYINNIGDYLLHDAP